MLQIKKKVMPNVKKKTIQNVKNIKGKITSKKTTKKISIKSKKSTKKMENKVEIKQEKTDTHTINNDYKDELVARHLLRLYQFMKKNDPINEQKLLEEMDKGTPNEELRLKITQLDLEIENIYEENHALRQQALQTQIEAEEQVESVEFENRDLKEKVKEINSFVKTELDKRAKRFEIITEDLRARLRDAIEKNEKITEVSEKIEYMQQQVTTLFDQNEILSKQNTELDLKLLNVKEKFDESQDKNQKLRIKNKELKKKVDLQKLVINGYKRKEAKN